MNIGWEAALLMAAEEQRETDGARVSPPPHPPAGPTTYCSLSSFRCKGQRVSWLSGLLGQKTGVWVVWTIEMMLLFTVWES